MTETSISVSPHPIPGRSCLCDLEFMDPRGAFCGTPCTPEVRNFCITAPVMHVVTFPPQTLSLLPALLSVR